MIVSRKIDRCGGRRRRARFLNHSTDRTADRRRPPAFFGAIRDLSGEEITSDYAYAREAGDEEHAFTRYPCRCGAPGCRRTILAPED
jgi:SET domain-containing protein